MSTKDEGSDTQPGLQWTKSIDEMLSNWCDQAKSFEWMNTEAYARYSKLSTGMSITVNTAIALSGIANLIVGNAQVTNIPPSSILGCVSIVISIISMLQDKFDWLTMSNNFQNASVKWSNVIRKIEEQLSIPHGARKDCGTFLKYVKQDINDVSSTNYMIPKDIRDKCYQKFSNIEGFDLPDICGQVEHTSYYIELEPLKTPLLPDTNGSTGSVHTTESS